MFIPSRVAERAATKWVERGGCRVSTYSVGSHGYAQVGWVDGGVGFGTTAHRAALVHHTGEQIPEGYTVDHTCRNKRCVTPEHLRVMTNIDNARMNINHYPERQACARNHDPSHMRPKKRRRRNGEAYYALSCAACIDESRKRYVSRKRRARAA